MRNDIESTGAKTKLVALDGVMFELGVLRYTSGELKIFMQAKDTDALRGHKRVTEIIAREFGNEDK